MNLRLNANAIITNSEGKLLIIKLKKGPFAGKLCIPGGGINPGELSQETIKREILEETGLIIENRFCHIGFCELINKTIESHRLVVLLATNSDGKVFETEEGIPGWYSLEELGFLGEELIPFAKESIRIWRTKENYFKIVEN